MDLEEFVIGFVMIYLGLGVLFGLIFLLVGLRRLDHSTKGSSWGFKLIILPGMMALWPLLMMKWMASR